MDIVIGNHYGKWKVVAQAIGKSEKHIASYICQCDCGVLKTKTRYSILTKSSHGCKDCSMSTYAKRWPSYESESELVGEVFGKWTVVTKLSVPGKKLLYQCQCACGALKDFSPKVLKKSTHCSDCRKKATALRALKNSPSGSKYNKHQEKEKKTSPINDYRKSVR